MATWADVIALGRALPEVEESTSFGTPALKVRKKMVARLKQDGETMVVRVDIGDRELLMASEPDTFFITPHYADYPAVLVRLANIDREELREVLAESWLIQAPVRLRREHEQRIVAEIAASKDPPTGGSVRNAN